MPARVAAGRSWLWYLCQEDRANSRMLRLLDAGVTRTQIQSLRCYWPVHTITATACAMQLAAVEGQR